MELYGLAPWVGAGTFAEPYATQPMLSSWVWRAQLIHLGLSCWNTSTGELSSDPEQLANMNRAAATQKELFHCGGWGIGSCEAPEYYRDVLADPSGADLPFRGDSLEAFADHARSEQQVYLDALSMRFDSFDWSDPVTASVYVIDDLDDGSGDSISLWAYYRDILNPSLPTPDGPEQLYIPGAGPWRINVSRVAQIAATPHSLDNPIWRAEVAYRLIAYTEGVRALDVAGL